MEKENKKKHEFSKIDFYRRCTAIMKAKEETLMETIKYEFAKQLDDNYNIYPAFQVYLGEKILNDILKKL